MASTYRVIGWTYAATCAVLAFSARPAVPVRSRVVAAAPAPKPPRAVPRQPPAPTPVAPVAPAAPPPAPVAPVRSATADAEEWFRRAKPYCNAVEVSNVQRDTPAPKSVEGAGYFAACLALAGRIDGARRAIDELPGRDRERAAEIVFDIGHPVADAGDDRSAGPIMELVVDYIPTHFMALYHAGMAEYMLGQRDLARRNLTEFLKYYPPPDGWRHNAEDVLKRLNDPSAADPRRPREP